MNASPFTVDQRYKTVAQTLHKQLPALCPHGLFTAKNDDPLTWEYSFVAKQHKMWVEEVHITVRRNPKNNMTTVINVDYVKTETGLISSKKTPNPAAAAEWTTTIEKLINDAKPEPKQTP